jgi:hypothetical protein
MSLQTASADIQRATGPARHRGRWLGEFSQRVIHEFGGRLVRINPREFRVPSSMDAGIDSGALAALRAIDSCISAR